MQDHAHRSRQKNLSHNHETRRSTRSARGPWSVTSRPAAARIALGIDLDEETHEEAAEGWVGDQVLPAGIALPTIV